MLICPGKWTNAANWISNTILDDCYCLQARLFPVTQYEGSVVDTYITLMWNIYAQWTIFVAFS